jgi:Aminoglycoside-2''-adenylyltransferase
MDGPRDFDQLAAVVAPLRDFNRPWFIAGGWAIDLFVAEVTRRHEDVDVAVFRNDQVALFEAFGGWWTIEKVLPDHEQKLDGGARAEWRGERLVLPVHQVFARRDLDSDPIEFLFNESEGDFWHFRRQPEVTMNVDMISGRHRHLPYLAPEIVLLYKAKHCRPRDEEDFQRVRPRLTRAQRLWLHHALTLCHPGHAWINLLA